MATNGVNGVNGVNGTNGNGNGISGWKHYNEGTFLFTVSPRPQGSHTAPSILTTVPHSPSL